MVQINEWWLWAGFFIFILTMLTVDIFLFSGKKAHRISTREALSWVIVWMTLAFMFNFLLWRYLTATVGSGVANQKAFEFITGYLIELSLSVDNMFIFITIFSYFAIPAKYQRRVLLYGVLGAIVMRLMMISLGVFLVSKFHWILYLFGALLIYTGIKMLVMADEKPDLDQNPMLNWMRSHLRITQSLHAEKFFIRSKKLLYVTPLFVVLVLIEISDLIFALDSIPAIFAVTNDTFIIFTSNIFAILGLRAMYFLLSNIAERFALLKYGIAAILMFIGCKMLLAYWFKIPIVVALGVVGTILATSLIVSMIKSNGGQA